MKKRSAKNESRFKRLFNKMGMTYVELICALALLSLIVMMFTPMLLSSYEQLYAAGEKVENVYDSKKEIETGLATRFEETTITITDVGFKQNTNTLFATMNVKLKKIVSTMSTGLETAFGTSRASVDIISPSIVYDNQDNHDVVIQTAGIEYSKVIFGKFNYTDDEFIAIYNSVVDNSDEDGTGLIFIEVSIPDKNSSGSTTDFVDENVVYSKELAKITMNGSEVANGTMYDLSSLSTEGRIKFNVSGNSERLDFTQSPVRICVYYVNTRNKVRCTSDYLIIEPPSMIFAGDATTGIDYYTSAGVEKEENIISTTASGNRVQVEYSFKNQARNMTVENSGLFTTADTPSGSGSRIQTITWVDSDENQYFRPYYVMAGTNSKVYRMYNYSRMTDLSTAYSSVGVTLSSPINTTDGSTILSNDTQAHPSFWSGEMSDQYYFRTLENANGYGNAPDNTTDCSTGTRYNYFDKDLRYSLMFSAYNTGYDYQHQANRRISYVLTEVGNKSFRLGGRKNKEADFVGYQAPWEAESDRMYFQMRSVFQYNTDDERVVYLYRDLNTANYHFDRSLAYLRLKSYISVDPHAFATTTPEYTEALNKGDFWFPVNSDGEGDLDGCKPNTEYQWLTGDGKGNNVNVTSSIFLPGAGSAGQGQVIYLGTVPAYALALQSSDIGNTNNATKVYNSDNVKESRSTAYVIKGSDDSGTTIYRHVSSGNNSQDSSDALRDAGYNNSATQEKNPETFYTNDTTDTVYKYTDTTTEFTFGYCSRWRMTVGDTTSNGSVEATKSYEKYYTNSNPSAKGVKVPGSINGGDTNNLYYNVWFPGEYYNLTHVATCDEVTVAVGYALSGSAFMKEAFPIKGEGYYGTALGSVYNDAVLAAYVSGDAGGTVFKDGLSGKGEQNTIFQNVLYYKSPTFTNPILHSRESIRFTAVGLFALPDDAAGKKDYYAVYGDNHGNAYYSIIATSKIEPGEPKKDANGNLIYDESGEVVLETKESEVQLRSGSNALKVDEAYPVLINDQPLSQYFSKITSIVAEEGFVVISGTPDTEKCNKEMIVILYLEEQADGTKSWRFYAIENKDGSTKKNFTGQINQAMLLGGYYYFLGGDSNGESGKKGWIAAVEIDVLKSMKHDDYLSSYKENATVIKTITETSNGTTTTTDEYVAVYCYTDTALYALGGRITTG